MKIAIDRVSGPLHATLAPACLWLLFTSPWVAMYREVPQAARWADLAHVWIGLATLPLAAFYLLACAGPSLWRSYFPWIAGDFDGLSRDIGGLFRGQRPMNEGGGLFAAIEGLVLLALVVTAGSGALWFAAQGAEAAVALRAFHVGAAHAFAVLLGLHVVAASLHLVDLVRN